MEDGEAGDNSQIRFIGSWSRLNDGDPESAFWDPTVSAGFHDFKYRGIEENPCGEILSEKAKPYIPHAVMVKKYLDFKLYQHPKIESTTHKCTCDIRDIMTVGYGCKCGGC